MLPDEHGPRDPPLTDMDGQRSLTGTASVDAICPLPPPHLGDLLRAIQPFVSPVSVVEVTSSSPSLLDSEIQPPNRSSLTGPRQDQDFDAGSLPSQLSVVAEDRRLATTSEQQTQLAQDSSRAQRTMSSITQDSVGKPSLSEDLPERSKLHGLEAHSAAENNTSTWSFHCLPQDTMRSHTISNQDHALPLPDPNAQADFQRASRQAHTPDVLTSAGTVGPISSAHTERFSQFQAPDGDRHPALRARLSESPASGYHSSDVNSAKMERHPHPQTELPPTTNALKPSQHQSTTRQMPSAESEAQWQKTGASPHPGARPIDPTSVSAADHEQVPGSLAATGTDHATTSRRRRKSLCDILHRGSSQSELPGDVQGGVENKTDCMEQRFKAHPFWHTWEYRANIQTRPAGSAQQCPWDAATTAAFQSTVE